MSEKPQEDRKEVEFLVSQKDAIRMLRGDIPIPTGITISRLRTIVFGGFKGAGVTFGRKRGTRGGKYSNKDP